MTLEVLTPAEMAKADRLAIARGPLGGYALMCNAGAAVAAEVLARYPGAPRFDVLCGPGNNGGDGYVVARLLHEAGAAVRVYAERTPREGSDAALAARDCPTTPLPLDGFRPEAGSVVIDALYGAGLARPLEGAARKAAESCDRAGVPVVAIDLPSGISGESGRALGEAFAADLTVTFFRLKPGHLLEPGRERCGETVLVDIGIPQGVLREIVPAAFVNTPELWRTALPSAKRGQHKYSRGYAAVFSGGHSSTGAARLSAMAAARAGAGAVTVFSPASALAVNAAHLTSIMLRKVDDTSDLVETISARKPDAFVLGPGFGLHRPAKEMVVAVLKEASEGVLVLDADGLTAFREAPEALFSATRQSVLDVVLTPHEGEFLRLFPDLADNETRSKLERARQAAERAGAVVILKGPDTVIAAPDGRAAINANGSPWLATAGSGDVLAGLVAGLTAQKMPAWEAACAAVWMHADAALRFGPGLIAEDLPGLIPPVLRELL